MGEYAAVGYREWLEIAEKSGANSERKRYSDCGVHL